MLLVDQINELHEDGLKSSPETSRYTESKWISRKNQNKLYFLKPYWYYQNSSDIHPDLCSDDVGGWRYDFYVGYKSSQVATFSSEC